MNMVAACSMSLGAEMYSFIQSDQFVCISGLQFGISKYTKMILKYINQPTGTLSKSKTVTVSVKTLHVSVFYIALQITMQNTDPFNYLELFYTKHS